MGTLIEEIFSYKLGRAVEQGETVVVNVDRVMSHDTTTPLAIQALRKLTRQDGGRVFDATRSHIVFDHIIPAATVAAATLQRDIRTFAREQDIPILQEGICHQVMPEHGYVIPGDIIVGADSHTCTYGALGAFATGMGSTDIGVAYATGRSWFRVPQTINIHITGTLPHGVYAKDVTFEMVREWVLMALTTAPLNIVESWLSSFRSANALRSATWRLKWAARQDLLRLMLLPRTGCKGAPTAPILCLSPS